MEFVGRDADLCTEPEDAAVIESGAGVHHHGAAVDHRGECFGGLQVAGHNRIGVMGSVLVDVLCRLLHRSDDRDADFGTQVFGAPICFGGFGGIG